ncbi:MAG: hypothetical protein B7733_01580 [Myxococcales bacterium FL481]|nr:MAG: hypothetical protein B7733_01580 [Myxococcales bacterium FL481]
MDDQTHAVASGGNSRPVEPDAAESQALDAACSATAQSLFSGASVTSESIETPVGWIAGDVVSVVGLAGAEPAAVAVRLESAAQRRLTMALRRQADRLGLDLSQLEGQAERDAILDGFARRLSADFVAADQCDRYELLHPVSFSGEGLRVQWNYDRGWARAVSIGGCEFEIVFGRGWPCKNPTEEAARRQWLDGLRARLAASDPVDTEAS